MKTQDYKLLEEEGKMTPPMLRKWENILLEVEGLEFIHQQRAERRQNSLKYSPDVSSPEWGSLSENPSEWSDEEKSFIKTNALLIRRLIEKRNETVDNFY
jgi:hypothetical protein